MDKLSSYICYSLALLALFLILIIPVHWYYTTSQLSKISKMLDEVSIQIEKREHDAVYKIMINNDIIPLDDILSWKIHDNAIHINSISLGRVVSSNYTLYKNATN